MEAKLIVVGGDVKASEIKLKLPTIIGRGKGATLLLQHPLVSRQHCEIYEHEGQLVVRDMGSLNGTYVNNARLTDPTILPSGDLLTIGDVTFRAEYFSDPNLQPPEGPTTARITGFPTVHATRPAKDEVPDFAAADEAVDFAQVEEIEEVAEVDESFVPEVSSLDEIPALSSSNDDLDVMAMLEEEEEEAPAPPAPAPPPAAKKTPPAAAPAKPAPPPAKAPPPPAKPAPPASQAGKGQPGSRWAVPGQEDNETLRAPSKPKSPPPDAPPTAEKSPAATPAAAPPNDEAADFLAALGQQEATAAPGARELQDSAESFAEVEVEAIVEVEDIEVAADDNRGMVLEPQDSMPTISGDASESAIIPPTPIAEAAASVEAPLSVAEAPGVPPPAAVSDDDVEAFLGGLASEPPPAEEIEEIDAIEIEAVEVEELDIEEVEEVAEAPAAAPPPPAAPASSAAPAPASAPVPAAAPKRPHAAPAVPFAAPYRPAAAPAAAPQSPAKVVAPAAPVAPAAAERRPHAAPRPLGGAAPVAPAGPASPANPIGPPPPAPPAPSAEQAAPQRKPAESDEDLNAFLKGLGQ